MAETTTTGPTPPPPPAAPAPAAPKSGRMSIEDKLFLVKFTTDEGHPHIFILNDQVCLQCKDKPCTLVCPAATYTWDEANKKIVLAWENCIECASAEHLCPYSNIKWFYPRGGYGIEYKFG